MTRPPRMPVVPCSPLSGGRGEQVTYNRAGTAGNPHGNRAEQPGTGRGNSPAAEYREQVAGTTSGGVGSVMPERPPLVILTRPDGSPDWPAVNERTRAVVLRILENADEEIDGAELNRRAGLHGIHPAVVHYARRTLHADGHLQCRQGRGKGRPIFWRLAPSGGRDPMNDPTRGGASPTVRDTMTGGTRRETDAR